MTTHYETLGIKQSATTREIKESFIDSCKKCHPDVNKSSEAANQFRNIREAYRVLSNPNSKISYDFEIGNDVMKNNNDSDYPDIRSAKRNRQPLDSVAERAVKQR